jgi:hypothetical protein
MQSGKATFHEVDLKKYPPASACAGATLVSYSAKVEYQFGDVFEFDSGDGQSGGWIAKNVNAMARDLQLNGIAQGFNDSVILDERVVGQKWTPRPLSMDCGSSPTYGPPAPQQSFAHTVILTPNDPNNLIGPAGFGDAHFVTPQTLLPYTVEFENDPKRATAPAQDVSVTQTLDPNLDWSTFQLGDIHFGSETVSVPAGLQAYETQVNYQNQDGSPLRVDISAGLNLQTGVVTWTFHSVDPATGLLPQGVFDGFLPVDDATGRGEGSVNYLISPKADLTTGMSFQAQASVVFDTNDPLATNSYVNTIDAGAPTSHVESLPATTRTPSFTVSWSGQDDPGGSGVASYDIFVSDNNGPFTVFQSGTTQTSATFIGVSGHTYAFYSIATDNVGNVEAPHATADTQTRLVTNQPPVLDPIHDQIVNEGTLLTFTAHATDPDQGETLTYTLDPGAPAGARIDPLTGVFNWTPSEEATGTAITVRVTDSGVPPLSDIKSFTVSVLDPAVSITGGFSLFALEGNPSGSQTVATFTDPGGAESLGDYSADIDWGDNTTSRADLSLNAATGVFTVQGNHKYAEEGSYTISVTTHHDGAPDNVAVSSVTVLDAPVVAAGNFVVSANEGSPSGQQLLAGFIDMGGPEPLADYSADINWGDGSSSAGTVVTLNSAAGFCGVLGSHQYADEGTKVINVTIHHDKAPDAKTVAVAFVYDPSVFALGGVTLTGTAGTATVPQRVAVFMDPAGPEAPSVDYAASINWGDATSSNGTITLAAGGVFVVTGSHDYSRAGTYTVGVTVHHGSAVDVLVNSTAVIGGHVPAIVNVMGGGTSPAPTTPITTPAVSCGAATTTAPAAGATLARASSTANGVSLLVASLARQLHDAAFHSLVDDWTDPSFLSPQALWDRAVAAKNDPL